MPRPRDAASSRRPSSAFSLRPVAKTRWPLPARSSARVPPDSGGAPVTSTVLGLRWSIMASPPCFPGSAPVERSFDPRSKKGRAARPGRPPSSTAPRPSASPCVRGIRPSMPARNTPRKAPLTSSTSKAAGSRFRACSPCARSTIPMPNVVAWFSIRRLSSSRYEPWWWSSRNASSLRMSEREVRHALPDGAELLAHGPVDGEIADDPRAYLGLPPLDRGR